MSITNWNYCQDIPVYFLATNPTRDSYEKIPVPPPAEEGERYHKKPFVGQMR
jgi:hypothetical protein